MKKQELSFLLLKHNCKLKITIRYSCFCSSIIFFYTGFNILKSISVITCIKFC